MTGKKWLSLLLIPAAFAAVFALQPMEQGKGVAASNVAVAEDYAAELQTRLDGIIFGEVKIKKHYTIPETAQVAPKPNETLYGEAESPEELATVLEQAAELLDGQELYFSMDAELLPGSTIHYYLDETILAITWKEARDSAAYTFSEVRVADASQFRRHLSGGSYGSGKLSLTSQMGAEVNAVVACSADYYAYRRKGITVYNGQVCKSRAGVKDNCFIDGNGDLLLERDLEFADEAEAQSYMDEHDIRFSLSFGPILVKDGEYACPNGYSLGEVKERFPRSAICQMDSLHYLYVAANMEPHYWGRPTMTEFAQYLLETGCKQAYALDGGQTSTVVMNNSVINNVNYGSERLISDIIYFATAMPEKG